MANIKTTVNNYKRAKSLYKKIDDTFFNMQEGEVVESEYLLDEMINNSKKLKIAAERVNLDAIENSEYSPKTKDAVKANVAVFKEAAYFFERFFKAVKMTDELEAALATKYIPELRLSPGQIRALGASDEEHLAKMFADTMLHRDNIDKYESPAKKISIGSMPLIGFRRLFELLKKQKLYGRRVQEEMENYEYGKLVNEDFYNPFDDADEEKEVKPKHIADKGPGQLKLRHETFNPNRVQLTKMKNGRYTVVARTQFAQGEVVEICPVMKLGSEAQAIDGLRDILFELEGGEWGLVLGYGSLYNHADKSNCDYAYNKLTKQMLFLTKRPVQAGEKLTINYGKDYWAARTKFNLAGQEDVIVQEPAGKANPNESEVQPGKADMDASNTAAKFAEPNSHMNPAVSGVAIKGVGQS